MDENLMELRQRTTVAATEFIRAQRAYVDAAATEARKSETELKDAAEKYRNAIEPYDVALHDLRAYLLAEELSEAITEELKRTERLIDTLNHEKEISFKLIGHHAELKAQNVSLRSRHAEEE